MVAVIGANARQEATHHSDSHYHGQHERRNEQRKPDRTMVVGMPSDHGEQQDRDKQHDVAPVAFLGGGIRVLLWNPPDSSLAPRGGRRRALRSFARARLDGLRRRPGIRCSRSSSDVMTARKSATLEFPLPATPPSRRPPASGAAPYRECPQTSHGSFPFSHPISPHPVCQVFTAGGTNGEISPGFRPIGNAVRIRTGRRQR